MRWFTGALAASGGLFLAGAAVAAPAVEISHAVARVIVSPEPRSDIKVEILKADPRLPPIRVWSFLGRTYVDGGLSGYRVRGCHGTVAAPGAEVAGVGAVGPDQMPKILIHTPMDPRVFAGGAVFGQVGRSTSLELANGGCGEWQVGNVRGRLTVSVAGSGWVRTGLAGAAVLRTAGSGGIATHDIAGPLDAMNVGSGDIDVASVQGDFKARIAGSGHVRVAAGHAGAMQAQIAGSGDIALQGVADSLTASVMGSGDVRVLRVTGPVHKAVAGSGAVRIGS